MQFSLAQLVAHPAGIAFTAMRDASSHFSFIFFFIFQTTHGFSRSKLSSYGWMNLYLVHQTVDKSGLAFLEFGERKFI